MGSTSVIGSPSAHCACNGHARTTAVKRSLSRNAFKGGSPVETNTVAGLHAADVRHSALPRSVGQQFRDLDPAPDGHPRLVERSRLDNRLDDRTAPGDEAELVVIGARLPVGHPRWQPGEGLLPDTA